MARMFESVGVTAIEEAVYLALVDHPVSSDDELAELVGLSAEDLAAAGASLAARGFVTRSATRPSRYVPTPATAAIQVLILQRQEEMERARLAAAAVTERLRVARARDDIGPPLEEIVEVVIGREAIRQRHQQLQRTARQQIRAFDRGPYAEEPGEATEAEAGMLGRGVRVRAVYDMEGLDEGHLSYALQAVSAGEEARAARVPAKLVIIDDAVALLPLQHALEGALVVHPSPLLDLLVDLFERVWQDAGAFIASPDLPKELDAVDRRILGLLAAGAKDSVVARQVGMDRRSVLRRVARLMRLLGARSRFQAGALSAACGWLPADAAADTPDPGSWESCRPAA